jgi:hypothetical protein
MDLAPAGGRSSADDPRRAAARSFDAAPAVKRRPPDLEEIKAFYDVLSPETQSFRFHGPTRTTDGRR